MSHDIGTFKVLELPPLARLRGSGLKPLSMSKSTLEYPNYMWKTPSRSRDMISEGGGGDSCGTRCVFKDINCLEKI